MSQPLYSQLVAEFGERLFGNEWAAALGRLTGINDRTIRYIRAAALEGREYGSARGVLAALEERLTDIAWDLKPHADRISKERKREAAG
jgi:hypothetical protein